MRSVGGGDIETAPLRERSVSPMLGSAWKRTRVGVEGKKIGLHIRVVIILAHLFLLLLLLVVMLQHRRMGLFVDARFAHLSSLLKYLAPTRSYRNRKARSSAEFPTLKTANPTWIMTSALYWLFLKIMIRQRGSSFFRLPTHLPPRFSC